MKYPWQQSDNALILDLSDGVSFRAVVNDEWVDVDLEVDGWHLGACVTTSANLNAAKRSIYLAMRSLRARFNAHRDVHVEEGFFVWRERRFTRLEFLRSYFIPPHGFTAGATIPEVSYSFEASAGLTASVYEMNGVFTGGLSRRGWGMPGCIFARKECKNIAEAKALVAAEVYRVRRAVLKFYGEDDALYMRFSFPHVGF